MGNMLSVPSDCWTSNANGVRNRPVVNKKGPMNSAVSAPGPGRQELGVGGKERFYDFIRCWNPNRRHRKTLSVSNMPIDRRNHCARVLTLHQQRSGPTRKRVVSRT